MTEILEYAGVATGLLYLYLEIKQYKSMWVVGFLTSLVYVFVFFSSKLYADMGLQIYYVLISIYGFVRWSFLTNDKQSDHQASTITYHTLSLPLFGMIILSVVFLSGLLFIILSKFTDSPIPLGDAVTTAVGIVATWMVAQKIIENWIFWIAVNFLSVYIYYKRGLYPTMFLYLCYAILAYIGFITWKNRGIKIDDKPISMRNRC